VIVQRLNKEARLHDYKRQKVNRLRGSARAWVELVLQSDTVDLFHNAAAGYRAQFYIATEQGEAANRYAIDSLLITLKSLCDARPKSDCCWAFVEASLRHPDAKIWIHEGAWLSSNKPEDRNLTVDRWEQNAHKITLKHRFEPSWAKLTPNREMHLELKGGCLDESLRPLDFSLKPSRSQELHDHGYT
jgi:hypothetical protein